MSPEAGWLKALRGFCLSLGLLTGMLASTAAIAEPDAEAGDALRRAQALGASGDLRGALTLLENTAATTGDAGIEARLLQTDLLRRLGKLKRAEYALADLQDQLAGPGDTRPAVIARLHQQRALLYFQQGERRRAESEIHAALALQDQLPPGLRASVLNDAAILRQRTGDPAGAIAPFTEAARQVAGQADEFVYRINAARAMLEDGRREASLAEARRIASLLENSPAAATVRTRIALAMLYRRAVNAFGADPAHRLTALELLRGGLGQASHSHRSQSLINGHIAELYADDRQFDAALLFAREALGAAAQASAEDLEYRWEWVLAKAFSELGKPASAISAYARAIASLRKLRANLETFDRNTLDETIKPLYYAYADALLRHSADLEKGDEKQQLLSDARAALEELKLAEVQDYFDEQCIGDQTVLLDKLTAGTVVLYPVMLENRLELLLSTEAGIQQISVPVDRNRLVGLIRDFRLNIETNTGTNEYLRQARQLYDLLVRPLEPELAGQQIDTLVFVPDGPLRTIPLAALHDGEAYLIERFAVATTPGITLIDPKPFAGRAYAALAGGISESVQGFPALPGVESELATLEDRFAATVLENRAFTLSRVESELQDGEYSIVHLATHGQFGDSYDDSYLLTYDARLLINQLGRSIQSRAGGSEPLELLVLSACETAAGDDRAALGLAGVALRAGARSALATLWEVDDQSTLEIVQAFYTALSQRGDSKARSLQSAQLKLIRNGSRAHPSHWAPFLLIGNWL